MSQSKSNTIHTIGHSNHDIERFLSILASNDIQKLVDVRSKPYSRYSPQYNQGRLRQSLWRAGIGYLYLGVELGGHPPEREFYDQSDHVIYERLADTTGFKRGIRQLVELSGVGHLAIVCSEENPAKCHRHPLLARLLIDQELQVLHLRGDVRVEDAAAMFDQPGSSQLPLFESPGEDVSWRSPKRIR